MLARDPLSDDQARWALGQVMAGDAAPAQIAAFLVALRAKGVTGAELAAMVEVMLRESVPVEVSGITVDTCGTGGDNSGSANISTMAAVIAAAAGERVVKHGNRSASSQSGSADVLEALGIPLDLGADGVAHCVERASIGFCFARTFHPAMRFAGPVRAELGIRTVFNILGPLANPARPAAQVVGVADAAVAPIVAEALARRGTSALVVRGDDGLDEITTTTTTQVWDCRGAAVARTTIDTADLGIPRAEPGDLVGGDAARNAQILRDALAPDFPVELAAIRNAAIVNAAAALTAAGAARTGQADPLMAVLSDQVERARLAVDSGAASRILDHWVAVAAEAV